MQKTCSLYAACIPLSESRSFSPVIKAILDADYT